MAPCRRVATLLLLLVALAPASQAAPAAAAPMPQTAPCYLAAVAALTARGALYSQGGALADDPIDPATGQPYPRTGPDSFDCSGLVWWAYAEAGVSIGTSTYTQINDGVPIPCTLADLRGDQTSCWALGDLVFLKYSTGQHVAIYVGSGLFMDCYNHVTGCILHDVRTDPFYAANFWQARRIVSGCESLVHDPGDGDGGDDVGGLSPQLEELSDLVGYITWAVPQCGECNGAGYDVGLRHIDPDSLPYDSVADTMLYPFRWLALAVQNLIVDVICWLLSIMQVLANLLSTIANSFILFVNSLWKLLLFQWLSFRAWLYGTWVVVEMVRQLFQYIEWFWVWFQTLVALVLDLYRAVVVLAGKVLLLLVDLVLLLLGLLSWVGAFVIGLVLTISIHIRVITVPTQLVNVHIVFSLTRGALEALHDSALGWLLRLSYAMAYVALVWWASRYLSGGKDAS